MHSSLEERAALERVAALEPPLSRLEQGLANLSAALCANEPVLIEQRASELHRALAEAVDHFSFAARSGGVPRALRQRLALASAQVAAQREALARATAALDRAIEVLLPQHHAAVPAAVYGASGFASRGLRGSGLQA